MTFEEALAIHDKYFGKPVKAEEEETVDELAMKRKKKREKNINKNILKYIV